MVWYILKVAVFGFSKTYGAAAVRSGRPYDFSFGIWSFGILFHMLLVKNAEQQLMQTRLDAQVKAIDIDIGNMLSKGEWSRRAKFAQLTDWNQPLDAMQSHWQQAT